MECSRSRIHGETASEDEIEMRFSFINNEEAVEIIGGLVFETEYVPPKGKKAANKLCTNDNPDVTITKGKEVIKELHTNDIDVMTTTKGKKAAKKVRSNDISVVITTNITVVPTNTEKIVIHHIKEKSVEITYEDIYNIEVVKFSKKQNPVSVENTAATKVRDAKKKTIEKPRLAKKGRHKAAWEEKVSKGTKKKFVSKEGKHKSS